MTNTTEIELKELMLDEDFTSLLNLVNEEVNLMDILRVSHKELQHSNFLAWLFNPNESHNLGDFAIKEFVKIYFKENQYKDFGNSTGLSVFDFVRLDFDDLEIRREYKNIDLIFLSTKNKFCIVIENKIKSSEMKGQLERYRKLIESEYPDYKHKIFIYLSLEDQQISENEQVHYVQLNYDHIIKLIEQIIASKRLNLANKTRFVFEQYLQTLKSMLNKNEEIEDIAQQLYKKYKSAFDLVFKYSIPSDGGEILNIIQNLIANEKTIRPFKSTKTYLRFQPNYFYENLAELKKEGLLSETDFMTESYVFLFEFDIRANHVNFDFKIGQGDQDIRNKIYNIYSNFPDIFTKVRKKNGDIKPLSPEWHLVFQKRILNESEIQSDNIDIKHLIEIKFKEIIDIDLPEIIKCIDGVIKNKGSH